MNKKQIIFKLVIVAALPLAAVSVHAADWLFRDGKSGYQIVVSAQASPQPSLVHSLRTMTTRASLTAP